MKNHLEEILIILEARNPAHARKLRKNLSYLDQKFLDRANHFFEQYRNFLNINGFGFEFSVKCYLKMIQDMEFQRTEFLRNGKYSSVSFRDVEKCIFENPDIPCYHMHGLTLAQFLWFEQYERFSFFSDNLKKYITGVENYLEIGGGHGLYCYEALKQLPLSVNFTLIDISDYSLSLSEGIINNERVNYLKKNVLDFADGPVSGFITMGEVLEHVEDPLSLLKKLRLMIGDQGTAFISSPANSPMVDHIYLFNHVQEIRDLIHLAELEIIEEKTVISEHVSQQYADKFKVPVMFAAFIRGITK